MDYTYNAYISQILGTRVRQLRSNCGYTRAKTARRAGLHPSHLTRIEAGTANPSLRTLQAIASALNTTVAELVR